MAEEQELGSVVPSPGQEGEGGGAAALGNMLCAMQDDPVPASTGACCLISYRGC